MSEQIPLPEEDKTQADQGTTETETNGRIRPSASRPVPEATWQNKTIDPDLRIDLGADDAIERLDGIHNTLGSGPEAGEAETVTQDDERALEATFAELDARRKRSAEVREELFGSDARTARAIEEAALELIHLVSAGFTKIELEHIANSLAETIAKPHANKGASVTQESVRAYLQRRYEPYYKEVPDDGVEAEDPTKTA